MTEKISVKSSILSDEIVIVLKPFHANDINKDGAEFARKMFKDAKTLSEILFENLPAITLAVFVRDLNARITDARINSLTEDRENLGR